ncbi:hypothetical protein SDC9_203904 [bioreactor metagenome]|uniref:Uncharacterized protein n=1 Tax=bioreactor metagenome TaxID=1076179 RepID=A0A645IXT0_9ZZZZ
MSLLDGHLADSLRGVDGRPAADGENGLRVEREVGLQPCCHRVDVGVGLHLVEDRELRVNQLISDAGHQRRVDHEAISDDEDPASGQFRQFCERVRPVAKSRAELKAMHRKDLHCATCTDAGIRSEPFPCRSGTPARSS